MREGSYLEAGHPRHGYPGDLRSDHHRINAADGQMTFNPKPDHVLAAGDTLILLGATEQLHKLEKRIGG